MIDIRNAKIIAFSLVAVLLLIGTVGIASVAIGSAVGYESDLPIIYDNWNPNACDTTDTSIWSLDKDTLIYEIAIWYKDWPAEKTVSYVIEKDGVEFRKGYFMKGACHHKYTYWCRGSDTPNMVFPTGTYVMKLSGSNQCQNSGSNGNGFVKLLGPPPTPSPTPTPTTTPSPVPTTTPTRGYESDLPIIYDNWNPNACDTTDTSIWSLDKDTLIYEIAIWYKDWPAEKTVSYVIEKDGVEFRKGYFMKGACHHKYTYWCRGSDTPNMVFPTGTYVMKLSGSNQCQNSGSNGNGFVKLLGPPPTPIVTPSPSPTSLLPTPTQTPGFEAAFTVSGLLAMAYLVRRRGK